MTDKGRDLRETVGLETFLPRFTDGVGELSEGFDNPSPSGRGTVGGRRTEGT